MRERTIACDTRISHQGVADGVAGLSVKDRRQYLEYVADQRLAQLDMPKKYGEKTRSSSWTCRTYRK